MMMTKKSPQFRLHMQKLASRGGRSQSAAKARAARENGKRGGRPRK
jgi:hypothetical protein